MKHTITIYEWQEHVMHWVKQQDEDYEAEWQARTRFFDCISSCRNTSDYIKIEWKKGSETKGRFQVKPLL